MVLVTFPLLFLIGKCLYEKLTAKNTNGRNENSPDDDNNVKSKFVCDSREDYFLLPPSKKHSVYENDLKGIKLSPPFLERFQDVIDILQDEQYAHFRKIVEFGCADLRFMEKLKYIDYLTDLIFVDKDRSVLEWSKKRIQPNEDDLYYIRKSPLNICVYEGCVSKYDRILEDADAVICIELIQTLTCDILDGLIDNIFGKIKPELVIITTPNKEFNPLINVCSNRLRHSTHKFEWTRTEFANWSREILKKYPEYEVEFHGVCFANRNYLMYMGPLTQVAVFKRLYSVKKCPILVSSSSYKLVTEAHYTYSSDAELLPEIISLVKNMPRELNGWTFTECEAHEIPLMEVFSSLYHRIGYDRFIEIVENDGWVVDQSRGVVTSCPYHT